MRNTISTKLVQSVKKVVVGAAVVFSIWGTALTTTTPVCAARNKGKAKGKKVSSYRGFSQPTPPIPQPPVQTTAQPGSQPTASQVDAPPTSQTNTQTTVVEPPPVAQSNSTSSTQEKHNSLRWRGWRASITCCWGSIIAPACGTRRGSLKGFGTSGSGGTTGSCRLPI